MIFLRLWLFFDKLNCLENYLFRYFTEYPLNGNCPIFFSWLYRSYGFFGRKITVVKLVSHHIEGIHCQYVTYHCNCSPWLLSLNYLSLFSISNLLFLKSKFTLFLFNLHIVLFRINYVKKIFKERGWCSTSLKVHLLHKLFEILLQVRFIYSPLVCEFDHLHYEYLFYILDYNHTRFTYFIAEIVPMLPFGTLSFAPMSLS